MLILINAVKISGPIESKTYNALLTHIDPARKETLNKRHNPESSHRSLLSEVLARVTACDYLDIRNKDISFRENSYGKPFVQNFPDYSFNISHSGTWILCGAGKSDMGVDIEAVRQVDFKIAKRFFCEKEYNELMAKPKIKQQDFFYNLWTLKESYIKSLGKGLSMPLNSFCIQFDEKGMPFTEKGDGDFVSFKQYFLDNDYKIAVCVREENAIFPEKINVMDQNYLLGRFFKYTE